jgi:3D (Asp-Asp-Asp) domain-containing protein
MTLPLLFTLFLTTGDIAVAPKKEVVKEVTFQYNVMDINKRISEITKPVLIDNVIVSDQEKHDGKWLDFKLTHYVANCRGCSGFTRAEIDVRHTTKYQGYRVLSVDTAQIPLGSIVKIDDGDNIYEAIAIDTGGAIKGRKLDLLVGSVNEANKEGKKDVKLKIEREGWE